MELHPEPVLRFVAGQNTGWRDITDEVARRFPDVLSQLEEKDNALHKNQAVSSELQEIGRSTQACKLVSCSRELCGEYLNDLRTVSYCAQPFLCDICASVLTAKRAQRFMTVCEEYRKELGDRELMCHQLLLVPQTSHLRSKESIVTAVKLVREFRQNISAHARNQRRNKDPRKHVGPVMTTVHLVPGLGSGPDYLHLHIAAVTDGRKSKETVLSQFRKMWLKSCQTQGFIGQKEELSTNRAKQENKISRNTTMGQIRSRAGYFKPTAAMNHSADCYVRKTIYYLARPFKEHWNANQLMAAHDIVHLAGISMRDLHQVTSVGKTKAIRIPSCPATTQSPKFLAQFDSEQGWAVYTQR
jgi:hypothetical protein